MTSRLRVAPKTWVQSRIRVVEYISAISAARVVRIPGRWTFTATDLAAVQDRPMDLADRGGRE